ncbi:thioredoxin domain-containing protein [Marisediminicola sp. LYQ85]|uniref:DsbA family protein n=1 Tax=Marisediminicola sp. LYQ85 TaxID=3391062 RepID=UPI00398346A5
MSGGILAAALVSPVTWGIIAALVIGEFVGITGAVRNEARVGVLSASIIAFVIAAVIFRIADAARPAESVGHTLVRPVDRSRDHIFGSDDAPFEIVEYGDFPCGFCLKATGAVEEVRRELGDRVRYVWRHAPLASYHPNAVAAAEASEAAALQGRFFEYERSLFADQENQLPSDIVRRAAELGLDVERFERDLNSPEVAARVRDDVLDAEAMDITSVPTFFINGERHHGPYDARSLIRALTESAPASEPRQ